MSVRLRPPTWLPTVGRSATARFGLALLLTSTAVLAQPSAMQRSTAHQKLDRFLGTWVAEGVTHTPDGEVTTSGTSEYSWTLGGVWLKEVLVGRVPTIGTIHGATLMAYDEAAADYYGVWLDSLTPRTYPFRARWVGDDEIVFESEFDSPFKMVIRYTFESADLIEVVRLRQVGDAPARESSRLTLRREGP